MIYMHFEEAIPQSSHWAEDMSGKKRRFRKDATMLQPATGSIACSVCNAAYESETRLRSIR